MYNFVSVCFLSSLVRSCIALFSHLHFEHHLQWQWYVSALVFAVLLS